MAEIEHAAANALPGRIAATRNVGVRAVWNALRADRRALPARSPGCGSRRIKSPRRP
jgi:hypothetical protein